MSSYYTLLGIDPAAPSEAIEAAYSRQRERYDPARVRELDPELRRVAEERTAEIERAYKVLSDPQRRRQYDASLNGGGSKGGQAAERRTLSPRERNYAIVGAIAAVALVAAIWLLTGREAGGPVGAEMGEVNRPAPAFSLRSLDGGTVDLESYRGQVVLLNFWGTWCEPCKREMPALQQAHQEYGEQGLAIIGVNLTDDEQIQGNTEDDVRAFVTQFNLTYPTALDSAGEVTNAYRVFPLPTSFFIDAQGQIRYVHVGELTYEDVAARFAELRPAASAGP